MKIYTKNGDRGNTNIIGKLNVSKSDIRIDTYGYLDEVVSYIGFANSQVTNLKAKLKLLKIQKNLMLIGSHLADPNYTFVNKKQVDKISNKTVKLEESIDILEEYLPPLKNFIVPSGSSEVTLLHICRTKVRTLERKVVKLNNNENINEHVIPYLNRLSDYFFVLARFIAKENKENEVPWKLN